MALISSIKGKSGFTDKDAEVYAKSFKAAFKENKKKGFGTDEKRVIKEMLELTNAQRQIVKEKYKNLYGKTLEEDLKDELNGNFEDICVALLLPRYEFEAKTLRSAIHGIGTRDNIIIDLLCTKESAEILDLKKTYQTLYNRDLDEDIKGEAEGPLERIYRSIASGNRPVSNGVDQALARAEAQELYDAGEGQVGTDESVFVRVLGSRSFEQLKATFDAYKSISNKDITESIKSELTGDLEEAFIAIVESIRNKPAYFAKRLRKIIQLPGTKDKELIEILVSRSEIDMINIRQEYKTIFNRSLTEDLKAELSGHFEDIVLKLIGKNQA